MACSQDDSPFIVPSHRKPQLSLCSGGHGETPQGEVVPRITVRDARSRDFLSTATDPDSKSGRGFLMSLQCLIKETGKGLGPKVSSDLVAQVGFSSV